MAILKPVFLQPSIAICERIERGELVITAVPYIDSETKYLLTPMDEPDWIEWNDCTINNQPNWLAYRPEVFEGTALYLKNKESGNVYFLSN